ncbi:hypothetical protein BIT28_18885 [Photobacterium proteolyticum]|uniref:Transport permease protein n=1 Tax=Photobacterium proteolyticum TaxID=1903952 RepID=A0A1Q9GN48_9GAMM|nr:ABC transporter permease [Photobacterium proteolyticum]OLQ76084.1 hypothetical protein BIT28_18885 [Photobacterium proteolyticum]
MSVLFVDYIKTLKISYYKAVLNIKSEVSDNKMSYAWLILEPALFMGIYYVVFGLLLNHGTDNFLEYLLVGLVPWLWFSRSVTKTSGALVSARNTISQVKVSKIYFVYSLVLQETIKQALVIAVLAVFIDTYLGGDVNYLLLTLVIPLNFIFNVSVALTVSFLVAFVRDIKLLIPSAMRILMYGSAVVYSLDKIPEKFHILFSINPVYNVIDLYRVSILGSPSDYVAEITFLTIFSFSLYIISHLFYILFDEKITREVLM